MEYFVSDYSEFSSGDNKNNNAGAHFTMDDLLDFSKEEETITDADAFLVNSGDFSTLNPVESCNSSVSGGPEPPHCDGKIACQSSVTDSSSQFPGNDLCVPYEDLAELEWLSNFVEESFSNEDLGCLIPATASDTSSSITGIPVPVQASTPMPATFPSEVSVPGKARSKRPRATPCDWSSRVLHVAAAKKHDSGGNGAPETPHTARKCLHCASEKTPQWRTGPMGPKTLCNACGVRYKSGRLVPEYRPAASPTFVSNKHSNSHRKVLELRRQKEQQRQQAMGRVSIFNGCDDFMIHHHSQRPGFKAHDVGHFDEPAPYPIGGAALF